LARGGPVIPVFILDEAGEGRWAPGGASRWWLHHSLASLAAALQARDSRLILARGGAAAVLRKLLRETKAGAVFWNQRYEPALRARDEAIAAELAGRVEVRISQASLLFEPAAIANRQGRPFQVFTPFWRHCLTLPVALALRPARRPLPEPASWPRSLALPQLSLLPRRPWAAGFPAVWSPGEAGAARQLRRFVAREMEGYAAGRDRPDREGTSRLSPHLHFGEVSPRQVWTAIQAASRASGVFPPNRGGVVFLAEIGWREFAHHLLWHFPRTPESPLREKFQRFPWAADPGGHQLRAWQRGRTGYPIVDAGLRQLWTTGWMHNRVRMVTASFLVKHLRLPWPEGAAWFWDTLVDADLANNTLGWQWSAGCGADAAPYFRIFAPVRQGEKFDPQGAYVRRWVPELAGLPARLIHAPWQAPADILAAAGVRLGETYPRPMVDHAAARAAALAAFKQMGEGEKRASHPGRRA
jgi:deoxyribodipyrimidine photo-lyase